MEQKISACSKLMAEKGLTIAFAESATAGRLCSEFALTEESGRILKGGIACYDAVLKKSLLGVPQVLIEEFAPESVEVTREIAYQFDKLIPVDIYVAVTGLTTPGGSETPQKPVRSMFVFALIKGDQLSIRKIFAGSCEEIIRQTIKAAAEMLISAMKNLPKLYPRSLKHKLTLLQVKINRISHGTTLIKRSIANTINAMLAREQ